MQKVKVEREVIKLVNESFGEPQLCGLTSVSINGWKISHDYCNEVVSNHLQSLSALVGALCERSGERFDDIHRINSGKIEQEIYNLKNELSR